MKVSLSVNLLKAALTVAPKKDNRSYLNGVCLDFVTDSEMVYCATDGSILYAGKTPIEYLDDPQKGGFQIIVPYDAVSLALKNHSKAYTAIFLESLPDGRYSLGDVIFGSLDGKFPDYERVIPQTVSGEAGQYNPENVAKAYKAISLACGLTEKIEFLQSGKNDCAIVKSRSSDHVCVVMPWRTHETIDYTGWHKPKAIVETALVAA